jgi:Ca2+-binding RTX toxin-like protein
VGQVLANSLHHYQQGSSNGYIDYVGTFTYTSQGYLIGGTITGATEYIKAIPHLINADLVKVAGFSYSYTQYNSLALSVPATAEKIIYAHADRITTGNGFDWINGYAGNDVLNSGAGNDRVYGGLGNDKLTGGLGVDNVYGGAGIDTFVLNRTGVVNRDIIVDFSHADDTIQLENSYFKALTHLGVLSSALFHAGTRAHDANDRIIYNKASGALYYDSDGTGPHAQVLFAVVANHAHAGLAYNDFVVI